MHARGAAPRAVGQGLAIGLVGRSEKWRSQQHANPDRSDCSERIEQDAHPTLPCLCLPFLFSCFARSYSGGGKTPWPPKRGVRRFAREDFPVFLRQNAVSDVTGARRRAADSLLISQCIPFCRRSGAPASSAISSPAHW